jgi:phosphoribosyl-AMP cyclohydrolase / phosphoribosyl-ATP pyrophosphohydrolase
MILQNLEQLDAVRFDDRGLIPVVAQHALTGSVLMLAFANREALQRTMDTRLLHFYSRSRQELWQKGATSGNTMRLVDLHLDCDGDAIVAQVIPDGPACHTGDKTCFGVEPELSALALTIALRAQEMPAGSYTTKLLSDQNLRLKKIGEEATEFVLACQSSGKVAAEAADLLYHVLVALQASGGSIEDVLAELRKRRVPH